MNESTLEKLAEAAAQAESLLDYRRRALAILSAEVPHDAALFHALSPRVPLASAVIVGIAPEKVAASMPGWDELGALLSPLREAANRDLVASDSESLGRRSAARRQLESRVLRPFGQRSACVVHLVVRERVGAVIVLLSRREAAFGAVEVAALRRLAPVLAVGDALHQRLDGVPASPSPTRLRCRDQRLTGRQQEIVEHVAMGHTNAEIGAALGLSVNSVRNHLARIFTALGAANRADVVRLAVLVGEGM